MLKPNTLNTEQAANYLHISPHYLRNMRLGLHNHDGPEYTWGVNSRKRPTCYYDITLLNVWKTEHQWRVKRNE